MRLLPLKSALAAAILCTLALGAAAQQAWPPPPTVIAHRGASALRAEEAGIAWEDAEIHRLVSAAHAATADRELAAYDAARKQFARDELALQSAVQQFNTDVSAYNTRCSPRR